MIKNLKLCSFPIFCRPCREMRFRVLALLHAPLYSYALSLVLRWYWRKKRHGEIMLPTALKVVQLALLLGFPINAEIGKFGEILY